jgi:N-methylhydantoinase A/oxoprolinase/acetone carboxylase beta subunit
LVPVSLLAVEHGPMVHAALDRWLSADAVGEYDGRFVIPMVGNTGGLGPRDLAVLGRVTGPMAVGNALTSRLEVAALERLVARGLVMISGVTPSDASHVLGRLEAWDSAAAEKAVRLLARRRNGRGERFAPDAATLAQAIVDQLTQQTVDCLLEAAFAEDSAFAGEVPETLARHRLTSVGLSQHRGIVEITARLGVPVIGLGASAGSYYGAVGERLGCRMVLPEHAGVANAIGAVVGQVSQRVTGTVTSPSEGRFVVHLADGVQQFSERETAMAALEAALVAEASTRARAAGAEELHVTVSRDIREAEVEGRAMFIEAQVTATASGRPRVAHG